MGGDGRCEKQCTGRGGGGSLRAWEGGKRGRQEIFYRRTRFLFALATERDHYEDPRGKRFTTVLRIYIVKMQARPRDKRTIRKLVGK